MKKIQVTFEKPLKFSDKEFKGEVSLEAPTAGLIMDAGELANASNPIGLSMAMMSIILGVPLNEVRALSIEDLMVLKTTLEPVLPKL